MVTYYTQTGDLDSGWVDQKAQEAARSFFQETGSINSSQLRKFYGDVKSLERQWLAAGGNDAAFAVIMPMIKLVVEPCGQHQGFTRFQGVFAAF